MGLDLPPGPYRSPALAGSQRVAFGDPGRARLRVLSGLALVAVSALLLAVWAVRGIHISGSVVMPALVGAALIARARWGTIALSRERGLLLVEWRASLRRRRHEVALDEVESIEVVPASFRRQNPGYDLCLTLRGDRRVALLRAATVPQLDRDCAAIAAFLREHRLGRREADPPVESRLRVEPPALADEGHQGDQGDEAGRGPEARAMRK